MENDVNREQDELRFDHLLTAAKLVTTAYRMKDWSGMTYVLGDLAAAVDEYEKEPDAEVDDDGPAAPI